MEYTQVKKPNLSIVGQEGMCLAYVTEVFEVAPKSPTAIAGWENAQFKHPGATPPANVSVPVWFSYSGPDGHVAAWVPGQGIYSTSARGDKIFSSVESLMSWMGEGFEYLGWTEDINGVRVVEEIATPTPPPTPAAPARQENIVYTKLETVLNLVTNKQPTHWWALNFVNDADAISMAELQQGTPFPAYGKAQRTDGDRPVYYMTQEDFGEADTTSVPVNNNGVNTVDLSPEPTPAPTPMPAPVIPEVVVNSTAPTLPAAPAAAPESDGEQVPVKVLPPDPNKWKTITSFLSPQNYIAKATMEIPDLEGIKAPQELVAGAPIKLAGSLEKDGQKYFLTAKSIANKTYFGIPDTAVKPEGDVTEDELDDMLLEAPGLKKELEAASKEVRQLKRTKFWGSVANFLVNLFHLK